MRISTEALTVPQLELEISLICGFFRERELEDLTVMYGWSCKVEPEEGLWQYVAVSAGELPSYIQASRDRGIFVLGDSDLHIMARQNDVEFVIGHEADLSFFSNNAAIVNEVRSSWISRGIKGWDCFDESQPPRFASWSVANVGAE